jgi:ABC-type nitrate/sulfonate/bicarbonate transport system substrate-binding protein
MAELHVVRDDEAGPDGFREYYWTFLVYVDRRDLPHTTPELAEQFLARALREEQRRVDLSDDDTAKLLARSLSLQYVDLTAEAEARAANLEAASQRAAAAMQDQYARRLPALLTGAKLDALFVAYRRELERRASVVVLALWLTATVRRWWQQRRGARRG